MALEVKPEEIREVVREQYAAAARQVQEQASGCCSSTAGCCSSQSRIYSHRELGEIPAGAALASMGC